MSSVKILDVYNSIILYILIVSSSIQLQITEPNHGAFPMNLWEYSELLIANDILLSLVNKLSFIEWIANWN